MNFSKLLHSLICCSVLGAIAGPQAEAAFIRIGEDNGVANPATGIVDGNLIQTDQRWTRDNVYILARVIFVDNGATLTIEPGTIIRGLSAGEASPGVNTSLSGIPSEPGTLVTARGGRVIANGTADDPIIFTSIDDPLVHGGAATVPATVTNVKGTTVTITGGSREPELLNNSYDPDGFEGDNGFAKSGRWGGVVMCGKAYVSQGTGIIDRGDGISTTHPDPVTDPTLPGNGVGADFVEGMSQTTGAGIIYNGITRTIYGGVDDSDDSGVLRFVSIRYCGFRVGNPTSGNEINSLTPCGIGTRTDLEFIECWQNLDDGFEFFGGKNNTRHLFSLSCQDDAFDGDEGFRGVQQFWTVVQGTISESVTPVGPTRSGFVNNDYIGQEETDATEYGYLSLLEFDGGEGSNGDRLPMTDLVVHNATFLSGDTSNFGFNPKDEAHITLYDVVVEGSNKVSNVQNNTTGNIKPRLEWSNIHHYFDGDTGTSEKGNTVNLDETTTLIEETTSSIASAWSYDDIYSYQTLDPRTVGNALTEDGSPKTGNNLVDIRYAGSMRNNLFLTGWSIVDFLDVLATTNVARPVVTVDVTGANPVIGFPTAGSSIYYVIERSDDGGRSWTVLTTTPVTDPSGVSYPDLDTASTESVLYRAYAL